MHESGFEQEQPSVLYKNSKSIALKESMRKDKRENMSKCDIITLEITGEKVKRMLSCPMISAEELASLLI